MHDSTETDRLLSQASQGDQQTFEQLFARHREALLAAVSLRMEPPLRARVDPSDVIQETHIEAYRRLDGYLANRPMPFRLWLRKTAQQQLTKLRERHVQAARRSIQREIPLPEKSSLDLAQQLVARGSNPRQTAMRAELIRLVRRALARLGESDREVLLLRYVEQFTNQEIGVLLDISSEAVSKRHGRALLRLQRVLTELGLGDSQE